MPVSFFCFIELPADVFQPGLRVFFFFKGMIQNRRNTVPADQVVCLAFHIAKPAEYLVFIF